MKGGILVLEGPDASGKSTLAKHLKEHHNAVVIHATRRYLDFSHSPKPKMFYYHWALMRKAIDLAFRHDRLVVLDRHWLSEQVYSSIYRDGGKLPAAGRMFDRVLRRFGALNVICIPADRKRHLGLYAKNIDQDHPYKLNELEKITDTYVDIVWGSSRRGLLHEKSYGRFLAEHEPLGCSRRHDVVTYNLFKWPKPKEAVDVLVEKLRTVQAYQPDWVYNPNLTNLAGAIGPLTKYVLVGDQTNPNKLKHSPWPMFDAGASSYYLCEQLDLAGIPETRFCIVNGWVRNDHGIPFIDPLANVLVEKYGLSPRTMGKRAVEAIRTTQYFIKHPSHARRFNTTDYHLQLKALMT